MILKVAKIQKRFDEFQRQKRESIHAYKDKIHIVIYGAYNPPADEKHSGEKERLIKLRDRLKADGYTNSAIVEDFSSAEESGIPNLEKSLDCLEWSDLKHPCMVKKTESFVNPSKMEPEKIQPNKNEIHTTEIFAKYKKIIYNATYYSHKKILFNGKEYPSPTAAGKAVTKQQTCNGPAFWKFIDKNGKKQPLDKLG